MRKHVAASWRAHRFGVRAVLLGPLVLSILGCALDGEHAVEWRYFDGFSTNKAESDSYSHSAFVDSLPDVLGPGFLMYTPDPPEDRGLGFHGGSWVSDWEAALQYEFPLEPSGLMIAGGALEFDTGALGEDSGSLQVAVTYVGATGGFSIRLVECGHHEYSLRPDGIADAVRVDFFGAGVTLDNLRVSLCTIEMPGGFGGSPRSPAP